MVVTLQVSIKTKYSSCSIRLTIELEQIISYETSYCNSIVINQMSEFWQGTFYDLFWCQKRVRGMSDLHCETLI